MECDEIKIFDRIAGFDFNIDFGTFKELWVSDGGTEGMATHIWDKFNHLDRDFCALWAHLDLENRRRMMRVINKSGLTLG